MTAKKLVAIRVSEALEARIDAEAERRGVSRSEMIRVAIEAGLGDGIPKPADVAAVRQRPVHVVPSGSVTEVPEALSGETRSCPPHPKGYVRMTSIGKFCDVCERRVGQGEGVS